MVNIKDSKCIVCDKKRPNFNYKEEMKALYCKECSKPEMIDIKNFKCIICKKTRPNFNFKNETKALYCKICARPDMVNIRSPKCHCGKQASYNQPNMFPEFCAQHRTDGMIKNPRKKCSNLDCDQSASYGLERNKPHENHQIYQNPEKRGQIGRARTCVLERE